MPAHHERANAARSKIRSAVEDPLAERKDRMTPLVRTIGIARARAKIGMANIAFNMTHLAFRQPGAAAA